MRRVIKESCCCPVITTSIKADTSGPRGTDYIEANHIFHEQKPYSEEASIYLGGRDHLPPGPPYPSKLLQPSGHTAWGPACGIISPAPASAVCVCGCICVAAPVAPGFVCVCLVSACAVPEINSCHLLLSCACIRYNIICLANNFLFSERLMASLVSCSVCSGAGLLPGAVVCSSCSGRGRVAAAPACSCSGC